MFTLTTRSSKTSHYSARLYIFSFIAMLIVVAAYIWFVSPAFERPSNAYYSQLAISFRNGHLYLPERPSALLLSLTDPYDYELRIKNNVDFPWDVSLYKGRFYIYWGPAPSLILSVLNEKTLAIVKDQHIVFVFICGLFLYSMLLTVKFWPRFNQNLPSWAIFFPLLVIGLSTPIPMMLTHPRIYEAAVIGSQFFFVGGCYWAYSAIGNGDSPNLWKLGFAGLHWGLAAGTRIIILPAIIFLIAVTLIYILREINTATPKKFLIASSAMGTPLLITLAGLAWYNWMRFGSIFEFGIKYQLALVNYAEFINLFSLSYIRGNLLNYFVIPYRIQASFPFVTAIDNVVTNNRLAGLVYASPYILFCLVPLCRFLFRNLTSRRIDIDNRRGDALEGWLAAAFTGSSLITLAIILSYFFSSMNYTEDFMSSILLLATFRLVQGQKSVGGDRLLSGGYAFLITLVAVISVLISILLAITGRK